MHPAISPRSRASGTQAWLGTTELGQETKIGSNGTGRAYLPGSSTRPGRSGDWVVFRSRIESAAHRSGLGTEERLPPVKTPGNGSAWDVVPVGAACPFSPTH